MSILQDLMRTFPGGELKQAVTSIVLVDNVAKTVDTTVPANKMWILITVRLVNGDDVARVCALHKFKESGKTNRIKTYASTSIAAGAALQFPGGVDTATSMKNLAQPELFVEGNTLSAIWAAGGASTGSTDADGLVLEYLELDL